MKTIYFLSITLLIFSFSSCAPAVQYTSYSHSIQNPSIQPVKVYEINQDLPAGARVLGELNLGDSLLTFKCDYEIMRNLAKDEAQKAGGNAIQIITVQNPDIISSCYRFKVKVLSIKSQ
jgi:hypothetical protein